MTDHTADANPEFFALDSERERYPEHPFYRGTLPFRVGQRVIVSTRPAYKTPTIRDREGIWGFAPNEWRAATISGGPWPGGYAPTYTVQFEPHDAHWSFAEYEILPVAHRRPSRF